MQPWVVVDGRWFFPGLTAEPTEVAARCAPVAQLGLEQAALRSSFQGNCTCWGFSNTGLPHFSGPQLLPDKLPGSYGVSGI